MDSSTKPRKATAKMIDAACDEWMQSNDISAMRRTERALNIALALMPVSVSPAAAQGWQTKEPTAIDSDERDTLVADLQGLQERWMRQFPNAQDDVLIFHRLMSCVIRDAEWRDYYQLQMRLVNESWERQLPAAPPSPAAQEQEQMGNEPLGTFACPICGVDKPHYHPPEQVAAYRDDQARDDGWVSTAHRQPKERGWYLCLGVEVDPEQYGKPKDFWSADAKWSQLSWFKWVRRAGASHVEEAKIQEVLYFDGPHDWHPHDWRLRNFLGNAVPSGAESRFPVHAQPKYWRDLPDEPHLPAQEQEKGEQT